MTRMQAEQRAASYNGDKKRCAEGRSYTAEKALSGEWCVVTWQRGRETWREYE